MRSTTVANALAALVALNSAAAATTIEVDLALVTNGGVGVFGDHFDNGVLDPCWTVLGGSPGPEAGTVLQMTGGDIIATSLSVNPALEITSQVIMNLTEFPDGSSAGMALFGDEPLESLWLSVTPEAAFLQDGTGGLIVFAALTPTEATELILSVKPGWITAIVDGGVIYDSSSSFGPVTALAVFAAPEPTSLVLLGVGFTACTLRRGRGQGSILR